jgi:Tfp pilus assembly protein PilF
LLDARPYLDQHERNLATRDMKGLIFYLAAFALSGLGTIFIRSSSPYSQSLAKLEGRTDRRYIGQTLFAIAILCLGTGIVTQFFSRNEPDSDSAIATTTAKPDRIQAIQLVFLLQQAFQLLEQKQPDAALRKVNTVLQAAPQSPTAYGLRGDIYAEKKLWDLAEKDYQTSLSLDGRNNTVRFNLADIEFMQRKYDYARPGFVALEQDSKLGDLATYKAFLCDLFGGHEAVASKELDAFNQAGSNISYYFANAAWSLYHHNTEDARGWLRSASHIYAANKFELYASSLVYFRYLPLPAPPQG